MALYVQTPAMGTTRMMISNHFQGTIHSLEVSKVNIQHPAPRATREGQSVGSVFSKHVLCYCAIADTTYCVNKKRKTQVLVMTATGQRSLNHTSVSHWFHSAPMTTLRASGEIRHFFTFLL